ncbi:hypothetical protein J7K18_03225 [bacterium]|nr:hypothetical protein [bacterium]
MRYSIITLLAIGVLLLTYSSIYSFELRRFGSADVECALPDVIGNPAAVANIENIGIIFSYENNFSLKELGENFLELAVPNRFLPFYTSFSLLGKSKYFQRIEAELLVGKMITESLLVGCGLGYGIFSYPEGFETIKKEGVNLGAQFSPVNFLTLGTKIEYVSVNEEKRYPIKVGFTISPVNWLMVGCDVGWVSGTDSPDFRVAERVNIGEWLVLRFGIASPPTRISFGGETGYRHMLFFWGYGFHPDLGSSYAAGIGVRIEKP